MDAIQLSQYIWPTVSLMVVAAIFLGVYALSPQPVEDEDGESEFLPLVSRGQMGAKRAALKQHYPMYVVLLGLVTPIGRALSMLPLEGPRVELRGKLVQAGNPGALSPDEFLAIPILSFIAMPGFLWFITTPTAIEPTPRWYLIAMVIGLMMPFLWLNDRVTRRRTEINKSLPYMLDMLTLSIEAGLDFISAVERIVTKRGKQGALSEELYQMLQELKMGKTRREALRDLARRVNLDSMKAICANLIQADQLGTPLGPILRIQSEMLRVKRAQEAEKTAMEAPVKLLLPLLLIFICIMLIIGGMLGMQIMDSGMF